MEVNGTNVRLWVNERQKRDGGKWFDYSVGISKKKEDGSYESVYLKTKFTKDVILPEVIENGASITFSGFLSIDKYTDKDGNEVKKPMLVINSASFDNAPRKYADIPDDSFSAADDDIPF